MYLYTNDHVMIPRYHAGMYGSVMKKFEIEKATSYALKYYVRKNKVMKISRMGQRCTIDGEQEPVGRCIVRHLENTNNCTSYQLMANKTMPFCTVEKMSKIVDIIQDWKYWPEADIFNVTGCLPHCERDEIL